MKFYKSDAYRSPFLYVIMKFYKFDAYRSPFLYVTMKFYKFDFYSSPFLDFNLLSASSIFDLFSNVCFILY